MTLSVVYFNDGKIESGPIGVRCCADSLITGKCGALTPHAMKILKLNLSYDLGYSFINPRPLINPSIGFTFAGNLNVAMVTYTLISHLCEHFQPIPGYENTFPSIKNIANLTAMTLLSYTQNFAGLLVKNSFVELVLFGYCSQEKDFRVFHITPNVTDHLTMKVEEIRIREMPYFAIGTGKSLLDEKYAKVGNFSPKLIRDIIDNPTSLEKGVGGYFQRGWSNEAGIVQLYCDTVELTENSLKAPFCGFDTPINIGTHLIALPMFYDNFQKVNGKENAE